MLALLSCVLCLHELLLITLADFILASLSLRPLPICSCSFSLNCIFGYKWLSTYFLDCFSDLLPALPLEAQHAFKVRCLIQLLWSSTLAGLECIEYLLLLTILLCFMHLPLVGFFGRLSSLLTFSLSFFHTSLAAYRGWRYFYLASFALCRTCPWLFIVKRQYKWK